MNKKEQKEKLKADVEQLLRENSMLQARLNYGR